MSDADLKFSIEAVVLLKMICTDLTVLRGGKRDYPMKTLPIASKSSIKGVDLFNCSDLPLFYMNDYSKVGLQVSSYEKALNVLRRHHYLVSESLSWAELFIHKNNDIPAVVRLLSDNGIECQMADLVTCIYQG